MTDYLTLVEVLAIHIDQIERYGGIHGVRDPGLLESALFRPQTRYYADLLEQAAALRESLSHDRSFLDRNKRTAFAATYKFLMINGGRLTGSSRVTQQFVVTLYSRNEFTFDKLLPWLRKYVVFEG